MLIAVVASAIMLAVGIGPRLAAQAPDPPGVTIAYPGCLSDETGQPVTDGTYDFAFALYDAPTGVESPEIWFEDFGTASLADGAATVTFEPIFAETVNLEVDYHVFVTRLCQEPVLLYVTAKRATGFTVRGVTPDGGLAGCAFDYRVAARRRGYEGVRRGKATCPEETR